MTLPRIIGLCGNVGAGKDTVANYLVECYGYERLGWADSLKDVCCTIYLPMGAERRHFWGTQADKAEPIPGILGPDGEPTCGRAILETVGTQGFRAAVPDTWVAHAMATRVAGDANARWVVADVRFPNEVEAIRRAGGPFLEVVRVGGPEALGAASQHESNHAWRNVPRDGFICARHGDMAGLRLAVDLELERWTT